MRLAGRKAERAVSFTDAIVYGKKWISCLEKMSATDDVNKKKIDARTTLGLYMGQLFYFSEAIRSIKSAKTTFALTTVSLTISVLLILFSFITIKISNYYSAELTSNIKINVFLKEEVSESDKTKLLNAIEDKAYTKNVEYISKDEAAEKFIKETGEDFRRILDYNPLPASVVVSLSENYTVSDSLNQIIADLSALSLVDEVVFKEGFVYRLLNFIDKFKSSDRTLDFFYDDEMEEDMTFLTALSKDYYKKNKMNLRLMIQKRRVSERVQKLLNDKDAITSEKLFKLATFKVYLERANIIKFIMTWCADGTNYSENIRKVRIKTAL